MAQLQSTTITGSNASVVLRVQSPASSNILYVSGSGNVGIGTSTPSSKLSILGSYTIGASIPTGWAAVSAGRFGVVNGNNAFYFDNFGTYAELSTYNYGTTGTFPFVLQGNGGNVGIGETSPTARLEVKGSGTTSATTTLRIENSNASSSLTILDNLNVGIGTDTPTLARLQVQGNVSASAFSGSLLGTASFATTAQTATTASFVATAQTASYVLNAVSASFATSASAARSASFAQTAQSATSASFASTAQTATTATSATSVNYMTSRDIRAIAPNDETSGTMRFGFTSYANNNTSPWADFLHLRSYTDASGGSDNLVMFRKDAIGMRIWQQSWNSATDYSSYKDVAFTDSNITGTASFATSASVAVSASFAQNARSASFASTAQTATTASYVAAPGATTQVVFNSLGALSASSGFVFNAGNVGIGLTNPGSKLHVSGGFVRVEGSSTDQYFLEGVRTGGNTTLRIYDNASNLYYDSYTSMYFRANQNGGSGGVIGFLGGNVGIGEASPTARLEVKGSGTTSATTAFRVENSSATTSMVVLDDGNVGIGLTSPTLAKLQVQGNVSASSYTGSLFGTASFANNSTSASFAISSSRTVSASYALTASFALNAGGGGSTINVSYNGASVGTFSLLNFTGSGVTATDKGAGTVDIYIPTSGSGGGGGTPAGADGQIQYNNGGSFGGAVSMSYDDTNHRVGIGTNSPGHTLTVAGGLSITGSNLNSTSLRFQDTTGVSRNAMFVSSSNWLTVGNANYEGVDLIKSARLSGSLFDINNSTGSVNQVLTSTANGIAWANATGGGSGSVSGSIYTIPYFSSSTLLYSTSNEFEPLFGYTVFNGSTPRSVVDVENVAVPYEGLRIREPYTPTDSNDSNGHQGQIAWDNDYIYVKTANNGWMRAQLTTF